MELLLLSVVVGVDGADFMGWVTSVLILDLHITNFTMMMMSEFEDNEIADDGFCCRDGGRREWSWVVLKCAVG